MTHPSRMLSGALFGALLLAVLAAAAPAQAANWTCEGSAVRGTVLGAATIEPLTANKGAETCAPARAGLAGATAALPLPLSLSALGAETTVENADQAVAAQKVGAVGGIADLRVRALPELPLAVPVPDLSAVPPVTVPLVGTIDLKPAIAALLPNGRLPNVDILRLTAITAFADGSCVNGRPELTGTSQVAGLFVLGQEIPINQIVERTVSVIDSETIDPSKANLADIPLPAGVVLDPVLRTTLQTALDALPDIPIPATLASVKVTPAQQIREGGKLTQRALQVQVGLLGQQLVDLVIGEASVGANGVDCSAPQSATEAALQCTTRRLVLADVVPGRRVRLVGYADRKLIGRTVNIRLSSTGRRVARTKIRSDGSFRTTAPLPPRKIRFGERARYQAVVGREKSLRLKLHRRMVVTTLRARSRRVTIAGRVVKPLATPVRRIAVRRRVSCGKWRVVKRIRPNAAGRFRTTVTGPPSQQAATYRFTTRVRASAQGKSRKTFETFTLPQFVDLG